MDPITYVSLGEITKAERRQDGTVEFTAAKAAGPELDLDQQILDPDWLRSAMPAWFQSGGNLREQHIPTSAAGVATNLTVEADGSSFIDGLVVDPVSAKKVDLDVLKGLSVGIKAPVIVKDAAAPGGRVTGGTIVEVSLVDRPCNPTCKMALAKTAGTDLADVEQLEVEQLDKRDYSDDSRAEMADSGEALPDGSFPIRNATDLRNAVRSVGRAKDPAKAKAHIKARAKALGKTDLIPDSWKVAEPDATKDDDWTHDPAVLVQVRDGLAKLMQAELDELMAGEDETCDLSELLCSLQMFLCWWCGEADEGEDPAPSAVTAEPADAPAAPISLGTVADLVKAADPDTLAELRYALGIESDDGTATKAARAKLDEIEARLAKVEAMPEPGGPARTRPAVDAAKAAQVAAKQAEADYLTRMADTIADRTAAAGYRAKAAQARADAQAATA